MYCSEEKTVSLKLEIGFPAIVARQADRELFEAAEPAHLRLERHATLARCRTIGPNSKIPPKIKFNKIREID